MKKRYLIVALIGLSLPFVICWSQPYYTDEIC